MPTGKKYFFYFSFEPICIFQFSRKRKNETGLTLYSRQPKNRRSQLGPPLSARACRTQAATWAWASKVLRRAPPAWAACGPVHPAPLDLIRRPSDCFGLIKPNSGRGRQNPSLIRHLPFSLFALSQRRSLLSLPCSLFSAASEPSQTRASGGARRASMAPPPAPSPACALPSG